MSDGSRSLRPTRRPDAQAVSRAARPLHLQPAALALVALGGAVGTGSREALSLAFPPQGGIPVAILGINVVGAFLLGVLLDGLARRGPDEGRRRSLRLLLGTGFCGGFTTYSALAADATGLVAEGRFGIGAGYALVTLLVGALASFAGVAAAAAAQRRREGI
jgi:CrcB protein